MTFGVKKSSTAAVQLEPHLMISDQKIPIVKKGESFKYFGKSFNFGMGLHQKNKNLKVNLKSICTKLTDFHWSHSIKSALWTLTFTVNLNGDLVFINYQQHWLSNT